MALLQLVTGQKTNPLNPDQFLGSFFITVGLVFMQYKVILLYRNSTTLARNRELKCFFWCSVAVEMNFIDYLQYKNFKNLQLSDEIMT